MGIKNHTLLSIFFLVTILNAISGCGNAVPQSTIPTEIPSTPSAIVQTDIPTGTPIQTQIAQTSPVAPTITPLIDLTRGIRQWKTEPVLIQAGVIHDLKRDPFDRDPAFVLYADGTLIRKDCIATACNYTTAQLNIKQICSLMNTIEQYGFFEYDPSGYKTPIMGGEITYIEISAWQRQQIALYQLKDWLEDPDWLDRLLDCDDCRKPPEIKPALSNTYWLLHDYIATNATIYHPDLLAIWLSEPELEGTPVEWLLDSPSLGRLAGMSRCPDENKRQAVVLSGKETIDVADYVNLVVNQGLSPVFTESALVYQVTTRWLLPLERAAGCGESANQFPAYEMPQVQTTMSCRVSDGIIPTITPTLFR